MADNEKPNLRVVVPILIGGEHAAIGDVISKSKFAVKGEWQNLVFAFDQPRLVETDEEVGKAGKPKAAKAAMPVA